MAWVCLYTIDIKHWHKCCSVSVCTIWVYVCMWGHVLILMFHFETRTLIHHFICEASWSMNFWGILPISTSHLIVKSDGIRDRVYGSSFTWVLVSWSQGFSPRSCPLHSFFVTHRVKLVLHVRVLAVCSHCCHGFWMQWSSHILKTAFFPILWLLHPFHCRLLWCSFLLYEELTQKSHLELRIQQFLSILTSPESLH